METYKVRDVRPIIIRTRATKEEICKTCAINLAKDIVEKFEEQDKAEGVYEENFYEIFNERTGEIIK